MHILVVGNSGTGKTNMCKAIASGMENDQKAIIVFDPLASSGWPTRAEKFESVDKFFDRMNTAQNAFVFVDEAKTLWDANPKEADKLVYRRRHQGLLVFLIAQRTRMVPPNARNQCSRVFAFRQQRDDADTLAQEYTEDLYECSNLDVGEAIGSDGFQSHRIELVYDDYPPTIKNI